MSNEAADVPTQRPHIHHSLLLLSPPPASRRLFRLVLDFIFKTFLCFVRLVLPAVPKKQLSILPFLYVVRRSSCRMSRPNS